jgi:branched-chain amino acid aminotransferase
LKSPAFAGDFLFLRMADFYNCNGKLLREGEYFISPNSRAFRYGDGLFETMVVKDGVIRLAALHFERLFNGLGILKFEIPKFFTTAPLQEEILALCKKNKLANARIRLAVFRGDGGLCDPQNLQPGYVIQSWILPEHVLQLNENGLVIDIYPLAQKAMDIFSNIKSNNYLPYVMAALYAKENKWNDCLVLNAAGRIADSTIANLFLLKEGTLYTPLLSEGCVAGVMRKFIIENASLIGHKITEDQITVEDILQADEIFLTNASYGLRWVKQFGDKVFNNSQTKIIYQNLMKAIASSQHSG